MNSMNRVGRSLRSTTTVVALVASLMATGVATASAQDPPPESVLSHFLCYQGEFPAFAGASVTLGSQLGSWQARVGKPMAFCNPVRKTRGDKVTPIVSIRQHLKAYRLWPDPVVPGTIKVADSNQFGRGQVLTVERSPIQLLVPTRKFPHAFPTGLDHFVCHRVVEGKAIEKPVQLRDQFASFRTRVLRPLFHCSPARKVHGDKEFGVQHPFAHLVCYSIERRQLVPPQVRGTVNQFERAQIKATVAVRLCVPSRSQVLAPV
jgi:hypothetical protein